MPWRYTKYGREWDGPVVVNSVERIEGYPYHLNIARSKQDDSIRATVHLEHTFHGNEEAGFTLYDAPEHHSRGFTAPVVAKLFEWQVQTIIFCWHKHGVIPKRRQFYFLDWLKAAQPMGDWMLAPVEFFPIDHDEKSKAEAARIKRETQGKQTWQQKKAMYRERDAKIEAQQEKDWLHENKRRMNSLDGYQHDDQPC